MTKQTIPTSIIHGPSPDNVNSHSHNPPNKALNKTILANCLIQQTRDREPVSEPPVSEYGKKPPPDRDKVKVGNAQRKRWYSHQSEPPKGVLNLGLSQLAGDPSYGSAGPNVVPNRWIKQVERSPTTRNGRRRDTRSYC